MVEFAPSGDGDQYGLSFAGDSFNTAWYLARLQPGWQVDYLSAIGRDTLSDRFAAFAESAGIRTDHLFRHPDRSLGAYMIELHDAERAFHYWRGLSAAKDLSADPARLDRALANADVVYFSGITLAIVHADHRETLFTAIRKAASEGAQVVFDPNMRDRLWPDRDVMCRTITQGAAISDLVIPSFDDESTFFSDPSPEQTVKRYCESCRTGVVVKNGARDVVFSVADQSGSYTPPAASRVVDTTAAGDSFNAGFMAAFFDGKSALDAVATACALSGKVIGGRGALVEL